MTTSTQRGGNPHQLLSIIVGRLLVLVTTTFAAARIADSQAAPTGCSVRRYGIRVGCRS
jgi:hypothetical protein